MKKWIFIVIWVSFWFTSCNVFDSLPYGHGIGIEFARRYGSNEFEKGTSIVQAEDGGYAIAGHKGYTLYVMKIDSYGNKEWEKTFNKEAWQADIILTSDGDFIVTGSCWWHCWDRPLLIKISADGTVDWSRQLAFGYNPKSVQQTADGGYITGGTDFSDDMSLIKTNSLGKTEWQKSYGGYDLEDGYDAIQTADGGYAIVGYTYSYDIHCGDVYFVKTNSDGVKEWQRVYGGNGLDIGKSISQTVDGGFIIGGITDSFGATTFVPYLIKTDSLGNLEWQRIYSKNELGSISSVRQTYDGGYIFTGWLGGDLYIAKTDPLGNIEWQRRYGADKGDAGYDIIPTSDGRYISVGCSYYSGKSEIYVVKIFEF